MKSVRHAFHLATLLVPAWLAWFVAFSQAPSNELARTVTHAMGPIWMLVALGLVLRAAGSAMKATSGRDTLERLDLLTPRGAALAWLSALAILLAVWTGYASFAVLGMLGSGVFHLVVLRAFVALRGRDPFGVGTVRRTFEPEMLVEGDAVLEKLHFDGTRVPLGYRLFVTGRIGRRWATTRAVLASSESGGEVVLESEVGPALRGEHRPQPLAAWLEDGLGLCRSPELAIPGPSFTVLPRVREGQALPLPEHGMGPHAARPRSRLPTEGLFDLREYRAGDDVRRIHWMRSAAARELVVRMPDEIPPDLPRVRLVLDTFFPEGLVFEGASTAEALDGLVEAWLAIGRALEKAGVRVTLVASIPGEPRPMRQLLSKHAPDAARRLAARVVWQNTTPVEALLTDEATIVVARGLLAEPPAHARTRWVIVVPHVAEPPPLVSGGVRYPHPFGASDNGGGAEKRAAEELADRRRDHILAFRAFGTASVTPPRGSFAAYRVQDEIRLEAIA